MKTANVVLPMDDEELSSIIQEGLDQIEKGEHEPFEDAIAKIKLELASWVMKKNCQGTETPNGHRSNDEHTVP